jgi:hypothetical protein
MIYRFAYAYVRLLLVLEALLFTLSLLLHVSVIIGAKKPFAEFGATLITGALIAWIMVTAFVKDGLRWRDQIKSCPGWMWRAALAMGAYGLVILCLQAVFPEGASISEQTLTVSGFPLGFDAISLCVLYSVLWSGYLTKSEVAKRTRNSLLMIALGLVAFLAHRAGYWPHPKNY